MSDVFEVPTGEVPTTKPFEIPIRSKTVQNTNTNTTTTPIMRQPSLGTAKAHQQVIDQDQKSQADNWIADQGARFEEIMRGSGERRQQAIAETEKDQAQVWMSTQRESFAKMMGRQS
ncbi:hypothetical protein AC578_2318 [Pseudocercospora eumusae]|uniref:Uncharacterized protein n=1 Tax=Pseudocercospora eumusae TaxID=321146 RepID=A0A139HXC7_9PEZI|nr:hypothetical protein AC578_2318 [Pseudocercospora eumusae]KXT07117.1 hypothetical protein AC578_2318 [Pseudocercospora eumusae]